MCGDVCGGLYVVNASDSVDLNTVTGSGKKDKRKQGQQTHMQSNGGPAAAGRSSSTVSSAMLNNIHGRTWVIGTCIHVVSLAYVIF